MSILSETRLKNMIKKYVQDFIHDFEFKQTRSHRSEGGSTLREHARYGL